MTQSTPLITAYSRKPSGPRKAQNTQYVAFCVWPASLSVMLLRFSMLLYVSIVQSFLLSVVFYVSVCTL